MSNYLRMSFKNNLKEELKYQGMLVKELADKSGVPKGTIDHYLAEKSTAPIAENAVKIAHALNVSVEYLVTGTELSNHINPKSDNTQLYHKYLKMLKDFDSLPEHEKKAIEKMIVELKNGKIQL